MSGNDEAVAAVVYLVLVLVCLAVGLCGLLVVACRGCRRRKSDGRVIAPPPARAAPAAGAAGHYPSHAAYPLLQPQPQPQPQLAPAQPNVHQLPPAYNQVVSNQKQPPYGMNAPY